MHSRVHRKRRKRHNQLRHNLSRKLNATCDELKRINDASRTSSVASIVQQLRRKLNVQQDRCDSNSRRANASQHQLDHRNSNNDV